MFGLDYNLGTAMRILLEKDDGDERFNLDEDVGLLGIAWSSPNESIAEWEKTAVARSG